MRLDSTALIERPRLLAALDRTLSARVVLVTAPAGYGKSVLLRDWTTRRSGSATAWLDLDHRDNDATRFWRRTIEAIDSAGTPVPDSIVRGLGAGRLGELQSAVEALNELLESDKEPLVAVFDDFHLIRSPLALESFEYFRDTAPDNLGIVLVGRHDPQLGVARLRLLDELVEIREKDLRFTEQEIAALAERSGLEIDAEAASHLRTVTAGWVAAIRLALVSASNSADPNAALSELNAQNRAVSDFFLEEVLTEMPDATQEFLLSASILDRVNASIASAISGAADSREQLEHLAERSILTTRLSGPGDWFRFHQLFRSLLSVQLVRRRSDADIRQLHRRAAGWYLEHHDPERAVPHTVAAGDSQAATELLAELSPHLMATGRGATLLDLSQQIIDSVEQPTILQLVCKGEALHGLGGQPREFDRIVDYVEGELIAIADADGTDSATGAADPHSWESPLALPWLRAVRYRRKGAALDLVAMNGPDALPSPSRVVEGEIAEGMIWLERYIEADRLLHTAMTRADEDGYVPHIVHYLGLLATSRAGQGHFDEAESLSERALSLCAEHGLGQMRHTMYARLIHAWLAWRRGDTERAESSALDIQEFAESAADVPIATLHAQLRSSIRWSLGDGVGARALLDRAAVSTTGAPITGHFRDRLRFATARLELLNGDPGGAQLQLPDWRDRLESGPSTMSEWHFLMQLTTMTDGPMTVLEASPPSRFDPSIVHQLAWHRLRAHAMDLSGKRDKAVNELASSLETAVRLSLIQPILDEQGVLGSLLPLAVTEAGVELPGFVAMEDAPTPRPVYVEPLTGREQEVLEYMATHLSYPEIAAEIYVSTNTVKSHIRAVFRKLAVSKRKDAVTRAKYYGLIA